VKDAAQGVAEEVPQDVAQELAFGARAARALAAAAFVQLALRWGRNWAAQRHLTGPSATSPQQQAQGNIFNFMS